MPCHLRLCRNRTMLGLKPPFIATRCRSSSRHAVNLQLSRCLPMPHLACAWQDLHGMQREPSWTPDDASSLLCSSHSHVWVTSAGLTGGADMCVPRAKALPSQATVLRSLSRVMGSGTTLSSVTCPSLRNVSLMRVSHQPPSSHTSAWSPCCHVPGWLTSCTHLHVGPRRVGVMILADAVSAGRQWHRQASQGHRPLSRQATRNITRVLCSLQDE